MIMHNNSDKPTTNEVAEVISRSPDLMTIFNETVTLLEQIRARETPELTAERQRLFNEGHLFALCAETNLDEEEIRPFLLICIRDASFGKETIPNAVRIIHQDYQKCLSKPPVIVMN